MKTSTRVINTTLCTAMLAFLGTGLVLSGQAWAAQEVEPTTQLPKKKVLIKSELRGAALPAPVSTGKTGQLIGQRHGSDSRNHRRRRWRSYEYEHSGHQRVRIHHASRRFFDHHARRDPAVECVDKG
ncbi:MAG: hypothetical protein ACKVOT_11390 [Polaromonas sp.]